MNVGCKKGWKRGIFFSLMRNEDLTCVQYDFHCWLQQCSDDFFWSQRGHILWATYITSAGELSWPPTMEEKLLWHPWRPTPCRHTVGAGGWWYMCSGEIVKSIWMSAGPPWGELELAGFFSVRGTQLIFTDGGACVLCQSARACSEPCCPWGGGCPSCRCSYATEPMASNSASFTQQCYIRGNDKRYLRDYWDRL